jgi:hypothetical protein
MMACSLLSVASTGAQEPPTARLVYIRDPAARSCPSETAVRDAVSARLGRSPWRLDAARTVIVRVDKQRKGLRGSVELVDPDGRIQGTRELTSTTTD